MSLNIRDTVPIIEDIIEMVSLFVKRLIEPDQVKV